MYLLFDLVIAICFFHLFFIQLFRYHGSKRLANLYRAFAYLFVLLLHVHLYVTPVGLGNGRLPYFLGVFCLFYLFFFFAQGKVKSVNGWAPVVLAPFAATGLFFLLVLYREWQQFKREQKISGLLNLAALTCMQFSLVSLVFIHHFSLHKYVMYYLLLTVSGLLLIAAEYYGLLRYNVRLLPLLAMFPLVLTGMIALVALHLLGDTMPPFHLYLGMGIGLYLFAFFLLYVCTRNNIASHGQAIAILERFQKGQLPEQPAAARQGQLTESDTVPLALYRISEIVKKHQNRSIEQINKLKSVEKLRDEFLRNVSHELRTPLTIISGYINLLTGKLRKENLEQMAAYADNVRVQAEVLHRLVENILSFSKLERKAMDLFISLLDLPVMFRKLLIEYEPIIRHMDLTVSSKIEPIRIYADRDKLYTVFKELLSNATKFTPKGGQIVLKTEVIEQDDKDEVVFTVQDNGIGIPAKKIEMAFEKFKQINGEANREYGGTGMGLALCRGLVELHNGTITIQSKPNKGTRVIVTVPQKKGAIKRISQAKLPDKLEPDRDYFLIVEDDALIGELIKSYLAEHGVYGIVVSSGGEIKDFINRVKPLGITLDLTLPDMDGWKVLDAIRSMAQGKHLPVMIITEQDERKFALKKGIKWYVLKPIDRALFDQYIKDMLDVANKMRDNPFEFGL